MYSRSGAIEAGDRSAAQGGIVEMIDAILVSTAALVLFWVAAPFALREKAAGKDGLHYVWLVLAGGALVAFTVNTIRLFLIVVSWMLSVLFTVLSLGLAVAIMLALLKLVKSKTK